MHKDSIAIIGMSCRLPGAKNYTQFWNNLINGLESISFFSTDELIEVGINTQLLQNSNYIRARGILGDAEYFDADFFKLLPREAEILDPQYRIFLESAWEALEDSGYNPENVGLKVGIFAGSGTPWYLFRLLDKSINGVTVITSNDKDYLTTKVSYKLGLEGPSINLQTACSTSLVSIILGSRSLLNMECDMILAGGVSIEVPEKCGYLYQEGSLDSLDGHCRTFDNDASGTVFSNGVGVVVLKRLSDAIRDRDHIYSIITGMAVNNDGNKKVGFSAPSINGQANVEIDAINNAKINPETISYVEAHGTATRLGDPIEVEALTRAFRKYTNKKQFCPIGSVKTNIGHTDIAAGVTSLIKTSLALKYKIIPKTLNFNKPNENINFTNTPFYVNTNLLKLEKLNGTPLRAMVNSFGVGGTNASVILEEYEQTNTNIPSTDDKLFVLSAKTEQALYKISKNLQEFIETNDSINLDDVAYTLQISRSFFKYRSFYIANDKTELLSLLKNENSQIHSVVDLNTPLVFMFPGQGNQYFGMAQKLYNESSIFQKHFDYCTDFIYKEFKIDLKEAIFQRHTSVKQDSYTMSDPIFAQPALFVIEWALTQLWLSLGVTPSMMIGHSLGEYTAACIAGVFSVVDALKIIIHRAKLVNELVDPGLMLAVLMPEDNIIKVIDSTIDIAAINSKDIVIVSGSTNNILEFKEKLSSKKITSKIVPTSHAFHSSMMKDIVEPLGNLLSNIKLNTPTIPFISTVTGNWIQDEEALDPNYWAQHIRKTVHFSKAVTKLLSEHQTAIFLEVGPGNSLESAVKKHTLNNAVIGSLTKSVDTGVRDIMFSLGKLWLNGINISWNKLHINEERFRVPLPTYPFEKKKFIFDVNNHIGTIQNNKEHNNLFYLPYWESTYGPISTDYLEIKNNYCWIIFSNSDYLDQVICDSLKSNECDIIIIYKNSQFINNNNKSFYINPLEKSHYNQLFENIIKVTNKRLAILHLWNKNKNPDLNFNNIDQIIDNELFSLILMEQSLIEKNILNNLKITYVTSGAFNIAGEDTIAPEKALILGACKVFSREYPGVQCKIVDLPLVVEKKEERLLVEILISETLIVSSNEIIAYRKGYRWFQVFKPINLEQKPNQILKQNGIYLISGGLGDIGLEIANYLFFNFKVKLILLYHSPLPNREDWIQCLKSHSTNFITKKKIQNILTLEDNGAEILLYQGDVSNHESMKNLITLAMEKYGRIDGVFHTAGIASGGIIPLKTKEGISKVLTPKVKGTLVLDDVLKNLSLDFFILFSSVTAFLGEAGQIDYCSANAFVDSFAIYRNLRRKELTLSINWGKWESIGMAVKYASETYIKDNLIRLSENTAESIEEIYQFDLDPSKDWIIKEHKLLGIPTLVGTSYLNMLYNIAKDKYKNKVIIIENLAFLKPLLFPLNTLKIVKLFIKDYNFVFLKQHDTLTMNSKPQEELLIGKIGFNDECLPESIDIEDIKNRTNDIDTTKDSLTIYYNSSVILEFGYRWQGKTKVYIGQNEWLAHLTLPKEFSDDIKDFVLHPAILDVATTFCIEYISDDIFLPIYYKKVLIFNQLPHSVYSYVKLRPISNTRTISLDIIITDQNGQKLLVIEEYTLRSVNDETIALLKDQIKLESLIIKPTDNIETKQGIDALYNVLGIITPQVVIYPGNLDTLILDNLPKENFEISKLTLYQRGEMSTEYVEPSNEIEHLISKVWQSILGIEKIGINDHFVELGGNSLLAIQIVASINDFFKVDYTVSKFYMDLTIQNISDRIINELSESIQEYKINL